ncbi:MAG: hypothetical protein QF495_12630, partial [SAR324 cluster bacterium]|nr:hypothetical protein [SAR324 cluster bacterium]
GQYTSAVTAEATILALIAPLGSKRRRYVLRNAWLSVGVLRKASSSKSSVSDRSEKIFIAAH